MDCPFCGLPSTYGVLLLGRAVCKVCHERLAAYFQREAARQAAQEMGFTIQGGHHFVLEQQAGATPGYTGG